MAYIRNKVSPICVDGFREFIQMDPLMFNCLQPACQPNWVGECVDEFWDFYPSGSGYYNHSELIDCLCQAYDKVSRYTGVHPTLQWECNEIIQINDNWFKKTKPGTSLESMIFQTDWRMVKQYGQRDRRQLNTVQLTYHDDDGDGINERATFEYILPEDYMQPDDIKVSYPGKDYDICPVTITDYDEVTRTIEFEIYSWNLVNPDNYPTWSWASHRAMDACDESIYLEEVDVYYDGVDQCLPQGIIEFEDLSNCHPNCETIEVPFCVIPLDDCEGYFKIRLMSFDDNGCVIDERYCIEPCHRPLRMKINYQSGCHGDVLGNCDDHCRCQSLHRAVYMLASVCLPTRGQCCTCTVEKIQGYQQDTSLIVPNSHRYNLPASVRNRDLPFGLTYGAIQAMIEIDAIWEEFCCRDS